MAQQSMHTFTNGETVNQDMLNPFTNNITDHETRLSAAESGKAAKTVTVTGASGLQGGGDLSADRTITPKYGTAANTVAEGNDSRINNGQTAYSTTTSSTIGNSALSAKIGTGVGTNDSDGSTNSGTVGAQLAYIRANSGGGGSAPSITKWTKADTAQDINTTTATQLGSSLSISVASTSTKIVIAANFDVACSAANTSMTPGGSSCLVVECRIDGTAQTEQLIFGSRSVWRGTAGQSWVITGLSAGTHTLTFTGKTTDTAVTYRVAQTHTGALVTVYN